MAPPPSPPASPPLFDFQVTVDASLFPEALIAPTLITSFDSRPFADESVALAAVSGTASLWRGIIRAPLSDEPMELTVETEVPGYRHEADRYRPETELFEGMHGGHCMLRARDALGRFYTRNTRKLALGPLAGSNISNISVCYGD